MSKKNKLKKKKRPKEKTVNVLWFWYRLQFYALFFTNHFRGKVEERLRQLHRLVLHPKGHPNEKVGKFVYSGFFCSNQSDILAKTVVVLVHIFPYWTTMFLENIWILKL